MKKFVSKIISIIVLIISQLFCKINAQYNYGISTTGGRNENTIPLEFYIKSIISISYTIILILFFIVLPLKFYKKYKKMSLEEKSKVYIFLVIEKYVLYILLSIWGYQLINQKYESFFKYVIIIGIFHYLVCLIHWIYIYKKRKINLWIKNKLIKMFLLLFITLVFYTKDYLIKFILNFIYSL